MTGTVTCACSWRGADSESTVPRSHEDVPPPAEQPKLNDGAPLLAGVACRLIVTSGTLPPAVHALTVHWAACPRSLSACASVTWTQRLVALVSDAVVVPVCVECTAIDVDGEALADRWALTDLVGTGSGDELAVGVVTLGVGVDVLAGVVAGFSVGVFAGAADAVAVGGGDVADGAA